MTEVQGHRFRTDGKVFDQSRLAVYGKEAQEGGDAPVGDGETVRTEDVEAVELFLQPPARFEGTLLSAMEGAGKLVDDEELREGHVRAPQPGTPATRAAASRACSRVYLRREGATWCRPPRRAS